ncbi:hypothetical protein [Yinghuangia soli]|uniref:Uncharacterized protein n=1 Tax=Yinghuangia soli TaxID=2908204 RepID=A0AA41TYY2_9ACTN|nr:hypothetical protein [Yinghuangia soli]MCF2528268.1 hypothetical protein [Yinghuangia soli]
MAERAGEEAAEPRKAAVRRDPFGLDGRDLLPDVTADERDAGWGDERGSGDSGYADSSEADLRRFLDEKPPHHL